MNVFVISAIFIPMNLAISPTPDKEWMLSDRIFALLNRKRKQHTLGYSINVESVPAETAAVVLCKKDSLLYGNPHDDYIYANQWLALTEKMHHRREDQTRFCA